MNGLTLHRVCLACKTYAKTEELADVVLAMMPVCENSGMILFCAPDGLSMLAQWLLAFPNGPRCG